MPLEQPMEAALGYETKRTSEPAGEPINGAASYRLKYLRLERLVTLLAHGKITSILITGSSGVGKTTSCLKALLSAGITSDQYTHASGHSSNLGLYGLLYAHRAPGQILICDDMDSVILSSPNIIKSATDSRSSRIVHFASSKTGELPASFSYEGRVIFITNINIRDSKNPHLEAVASRAHLVDITLSRAETLAFIRDSIMPHERDGLSLADRQHVLVRMEQASAASTTRVDARVYLQLLTLFANDFANFETHLDLMFPASSELATLRTAIAEGDRTEDAARIWCAVTKKSRSAFFLAKKKYADFL